MVEATKITTILVVFSVATNKFQFSAALENFNGLKELKTETTEFIQYTLKNTKSVSGLGQNFIKG